MSLSGAVGSSRIRKLHSEVMALAISTICFCASVRSWTNERTLTLIFRLSRILRASRRTLFQLTKGLKPLSSTMWFIITFSATVSVGTSAVSTSW